MTHAQARAVIDSALETVPFTEVGVAYCTAVRDAILGGLAGGLPGASVDVCHRYVELIVEVRHENIRLRVITPLV